MLVSLADMKTYLGITDSSQDVYLTEQLTYVSDAVELYCNRKFEEATYTQTFYREDYNRQLKELFTHQYPITAITSVKDITNDVTLTTTDYRVMKDLGKLVRIYDARKHAWFCDTDQVEIEYDAGFEIVPSVIQMVIKKIVAEEYSKKEMNGKMPIMEGTQSVAIAGVMSVSFDTSHYHENRNLLLGEILGKYANVLDIYRSSRNIMPPPEDIYVE